MTIAVWVPTVFTKNRERLIEHDAVIELFNLVLQQAEHKGCERLAVPCDNRHGLIANAMVTTADGYAEREAAKTMINDARCVRQSAGRNHAGC